MKASNWTPPRIKSGVRRRDEHEKGMVLCRHSGGPRIGSGAGAGIQDDLKKMKSSLDNFGLTSNPQIHNPQSTIFR